MTALLDLLYRWRVRRSLRRNGWPLFVVLALTLGACAGREIRAINAEQARCEQQARTLPADQLDAARAECIRRLEAMR